MPRQNGGTFISTNYIYITKENLRALSPFVINTLTKKYKIAFFFKAAIEVPLNQLLDLVHTQTFDPSLHRILLHFFNELFNASPAFTTHAEQLKPLYKMKLADEDSLDKWPDDDVVDRLEEIGDEINELIVLKRNYPELNYKQLLSLWVFEYLQKTSLAKDKTIATVIQLADNLLKEKKFEIFASIISEVANCVNHLDLVQKHKKLFDSLCQSFIEKPLLKKHIGNKQREKIERKLNQSKTPATILTLLEQAGFQKLNTDYCPVIAALVSTYLLIHHMVVLHKENGLKLEDVKNEFFRLVHTNAYTASGDVASDIINAFYQSDFYKDQIKKEDYSTKHTIEGLIDFESGESFNTCIKTRLHENETSTHTAAEIYQLHHLLNITIINLLQNKTTKLFKIVPFFTLAPRPDLLQTISFNNGYWSGVAHTVVKLKEGIINAPKGFKIEAYEIAPGFAFQPLSLIYKPDLMNAYTQRSGVEKPPSLTINKFFNTASPEAIKHKELPFVSSVLTLTFEQRRQINDLITCLKKEIKSCWPFPNKDKKRDKVKALNRLLTRENIIGVHAAIEEVEKLFPSAREGCFSHRTADLLDQLKSLQFNKRLILN